MKNRKTFTQEVRFRFKTHKKTLTRIEKQELTVYFKLILAIMNLVVITK